jgi:1D-myo-inositol 3-kinase
LVYALVPDRLNRPTSRREELNSTLQFDYISVGHVTVDILEDGSHRPGGTALYGALQASRLGLSSLIVTRGDQSEIEGLLEPWASEFELRVQPADRTTTFATSGRGAERNQQLLAWAGPIEAEGPLACAILHLAPVADELPERWPSGGRLLGLTPQGLARTWPEEGGAVRLSPPDANALAQAESAHAIVISEQERNVCDELIRRTRAAGALIAVTAGGRAATILPPRGEPLELPVRRIEEPADDLGAGDCYAAALFTGMAEGRNPAEAAELAGAAAALRILGIGPGAVAARGEIEASLADRSHSRG